VGLGIVALGTVFRITLAGVETTLYSFAGVNDGGNPHGSLIQASDGYFYGMTPGGGGVIGQGVVFKITLAGAETVLYSFAGGTDGASPNASLIQVKDGALYGMTSGGGVNGYGSVIRIK
jgi:uncharacterized repeat protein (TIGR03803 family)